MLGPSLFAFRPELVLCGTIVLLLLGHMFLPRWKSLPFLLTFAGSALALFLLEPWAYLSTDAIPPVPAFSGMLILDGFGVFFRGILLGFAILFVLYTRISGIPREEDAVDFFVLFLGATLGMCIMVSANHMLMVFMGVEMASVPSYVLAGFLKGRRPGGEAALKFAVFGGATAGVMLYGITLLGGVLGSFHIPTMAAHLATLAAGGEFSAYAMVLVLGALLLMVGLAFKLSAVPFHFWAPDVFEGATAEVGAYLSVASKAAALALLARIVLGLVSGGPGAMVAETQPLSHAIAEATAADTGLTPVVLNGEVDHGAHIEGTKSTSQEASDDGDGLRRVRAFVVALLALFSAVTCTFGNLAAYGQTNIKRLLAYSTIAHAGYMIMPIAAAVTLMGRDPATARWALATLSFYVVVYVFMNLGAFAAATFLRNRLGSETIADYAGLVRRSPAAAVCFSLILFSLVGLPPLAGFAGKFAVFASLTYAGLVMLLVVGALNTLLSLFYYLRVVKVMTLDAPKDDATDAVIPGHSPAGLFLALLTVPVAVLGVWWQPVFHWAESAVGSIIH
ncbi:NADH-quinone oxidoreductase subunit N [Thermostilla marina]